jgi:hypothetical protein
VLDNAERHVRGSKQVACRVAHVLEQSIRAVRGREIQPDQRPQSRVRIFQILGFLGELVGQQLEMISTDIRRGRSVVVRGFSVRFASEHAADNLEHFIGLSRFRQDIRKTRGPRERPGFTFAIGRGIEKHGDVARRRVETRPLDELVPVHHWHEDIRDHQIGTLRLNDGQAVAAVRGFEQPMSVMTRKGHKEFPIGQEVIVDYQEGRHALPPHCEAQQGT